MNAAATPAPRAQTPFVKGVDYFAMAERLGARHSYNSDTGEMVFRGCDQESLDRMVAAFPPRFSADDVRAETLRRLCLLAGARDGAHLSIRLQDAQMAAMAITDKKANGFELSVEEEIEAGRLRSLQQQYFAIKAAGNAMEADPPADYADDRHWPKGAGE